MPILVITQQPVSQSKAAGSSVTFQLQAKSEETYNWHWEAKADAQSSWATTDNGDTLSSGSFFHFSDSAVYGDSDDPLPNVDPDTIELTLTASAAINGHIYRCVLEGTDTIVSNEVTLTVATSNNSIPIDTEHFPDATFRNYVSSNFDTNNDGYLSDEEITQITEISFNGDSTITSVAGIEYFSSLRTIFLRDTSNLELSTIENFQNLETITIECCPKITSLSISNCQSLNSISIWDNQYLISLSIDNCTALEKLLCRPFREYSDPYDCKLEYLHVSRTPNLIEIDCQRNHITDLILEESATIKLEKIDAHENQIEEFDASSCLSLRIMTMHYNKLHTIDVTKNTMLEQLMVFGNELTRLILPESNTITALGCDLNSITKLNLTNCPQLAQVVRDNEPVYMSGHPRTPGGVIATGPVIYSGNVSGGPYVMVDDTTILITETSWNILESPQDVYDIVGNTAHFETVLDVVLDESAIVSWQEKKANSLGWSNIENATSLSLDIPIDQTLDKASYRCFIEYNEESGYSNSAMIYVMSLPQINTQPDDIEVYEGELAEFEIDAIGYQLAYQWQVSTANNQWIDLLNQVKPKLSILAGGAISGYHYRCRVENSIGEVFTNSALLTVLPDPRISSPVITSQPNSISIAEGSSASFSLTASGNDLHYQWQTNQNGTWYNIDGATSSSYSTIAAMSLNQSKYRCQVSNAAGSLYSNEVTLSVTSEQSIRTPIITSQPRSVTVEEGQQAAFRVSASGGSLSYQWQVKKSGVWYEITGAENATLYARGASDTNNNQYRCLVANSAGSVYSTIATLSVRETGPLNFYGYHSIIISGKNTYGEWEMYPTSRPHVAPPEVKTSYIDVPGADGGLDYTELLNGKPNYGYRKGSWEFLLIPQEKWPDVYRSLCAFLHGREHTIILEDDPKWVYRGRLSVNEWRSAAHNSLITIDYILDPIATSTDDEEYDPDADDLDAAGRILRKPGNEDSAIILWNGTETVVPIDSLFEDGDNILY